MPLAVGGRDDPDGLAPEDFGLSGAAGHNPHRADRLGVELPDPATDKAHQAITQLDIESAGSREGLKLDKNLQTSWADGTDIRVDTMGSEVTIEPVGDRIFQAIENNEGYISAALLARFDDLETYPRLPFEPIDKATYDRMVAAVAARRKSDDFQALLAQYDTGDRASSEVGPAGCDSDKCMLPEIK